MVTDQQNKANLGSASNVAAQSVGLDLTQASAWSDDQKITFTRSLAQTILSYPSEFTDSTLSMAQKMTGFTIDGNPDAQVNAEFSSADWDSFGYYLEQNIVSAGQKLSDVGNGVLDALSDLGGIVGNSAKAAKNTAEFTEFLLPAALVVMFVWLLKDPERTSRATKNFADSARSLF